MKKPKTTSQLKKILDKTFSEYIRRTNADRNGDCICVTCDKKDHWKNMHAGHYLSRQYLSTRFDENNVFPQCPGCNIFKNGNYTAYALFMLDKYGEEKLQWLEQQKHVITKDYPYVEKIEEYKTKLTELYN